MSEEIPESKKTGLAYAIAQGKSVPAWARQNDVPRSTAYYWAGQPEVRRMVETLRRRSLDRAVGRMASRAVAAADGINKLAMEAESESVRLRAWRAIAVRPDCRFQVRGMGRPPGRSRGEGEGAVGRAELSGRATAG